MNDIRTRCLETCGFDAYCIFIAACKIETVALVSGRITKRDFEELEKYRASLYQRLDSRS